MKKVIIVWWLVLGLILLIGPKAEAAQTAAPVHWPRRTVYVVTHVSESAWPVSSARKAWNRGEQIRLLPTASCRAGYPCVHVYSSSNMPTYYGGYTNRTAPNGVITYARVYMNYRERNNGDWYLRRAWLIHELGHAIGLNHDTRYTSVMAAGVGGLNLYTSSYDLGLVATEYRGVRW